MTIIGRLISVYLILQQVLFIAESHATPSERPFVVATTGIVADLVRSIAADTVEVRALMGPGVDPHLYKATHGDLGLLGKANCIFYSGLHLEGKMQEVLEALSKKKRTVAVTSAIDKKLLRSPPEFSGQYDPHLWFDVKLWSQTIVTVQDTLSALLPQHAEDYARNAREYTKTLQELDSWVRQQIEKIPVPQRLLITAHDAFGYFGQAYGIEVSALQGISTASEFGLVDVQRLINLIIERKLKAIFVETSVPERFIQAIQQGVKAKGSQVLLGGMLYSDALGESGSGAESYVGMVRTNVTMIVGALQ